MDLDALGDTIRELREIRGWSIRDLSERATACGGSRWPTAKNPGPLHFEPDSERAANHRNL